MPAASKQLKSYSTEEVALWLTIIGLGDKALAFRENSVDGEMLLTLKQDDLVNDLGLTNLQAKKVIHSIETTKSLEQGSTSDDKIKELQAQIASLKKENEELAAKLAPAKPQGQPQQAQPQQAQPQQQVVYVEEGRRHHRHRWL